MNEIRRVLKVASWRLVLIDFFRTLAVTASAAVGALIIALFAERTFGLAISWPNDWIALGAILLGVAALAALGWSLFRRHKGVRLAAEVDERANLKESLSTALCVARSDDPWSRNVLETARDKAMKVDVKKAIPITAPRLWPLPFSMALALVVLWFAVPHWDVLGLFRKRVAEQQRKDEIRTVQNEVKADTDKLADLMKQAKVEIKDENAEAQPTDQNNPTPKDPDEIRRAAVKKLTSLSEKLADMRQGDKAKQLEALKNQMKQLKQPGPGPLDKMTQSLQRGDFKKAQDDLQELSKQLASDSMSKEDKEKAADQLKKLSEQLDKLSKDRQDLEKQLEKAGLNKAQAAQAARDPEALKKAMEAMKNLSEEQKQQLQKMAENQNAACKQCNGMAEAMSKMAKGTSKSGMSQEGQQGMEGLEGQLSELEMSEQDLKNLDAAMSECRGQLAKMAGQCNGGNCNGDGKGKEYAASDQQSPWKAGETAGKFGKGSGGPGQSGGGTSPQGADAPVTTEKTVAQSKQGNGPIIGSKLVYGDQVKGESQAEFQAAVESSAKAASEALEGMQVRRELQDSVKHYFGRLQARAQGKP
jgi:hypothetical protein